MRALGLGRGVSGFRVLGLGFRIFWSFVAQGFRVFLVLWLGFPGFVHFTSPRLGPVGFKLVLFSDGA